MCNNKKSLFYFIFLTFCLVSIVNCCNIPLQTSDAIQPINKEDKMLREVRSSIIKVITASEITIKDKVTSNEIGKEKYIKTGSGFIIEQLPTGTVVYTAGHVCSSKKSELVKILFPFYDEKIHTIDIKSQFILTDINGDQYAAVEMVIMDDYDVCALLSSKIYLNPLLLSAKGLEPNQKVFMMGFPRGIWGKGFVPTFFGYYAGDLENLKGEKASFFTFPSTPGVSGGPIINSDGQVVSIIHAYITTFDNLSIGATINQVLSLKLSVDEEYNSNIVFYDNLTVELILALY